MQSVPLLDIQKLFQLHHSDEDWITWRDGDLDASAIKHFIGKSGRHLWSLEALSGTFIRVVDSEKSGAHLHIYGPCEGITIVLHVLGCVSEGFYTFCLPLRERLGL